VKWSKDWCFLVKIRERHKTIKIRKCNVCENNVQTNAHIKALTESEVGQIFTPEEDIKNDFDFRRDISHKRKNYF